METLEWFKEFMKSHKKRVIANDRSNRCNKSEIHFDQENGTIYIRPVKSID